MSESTSVERIERLLELAKAGDKVAWGMLLERDRGRLTRAVALRLDIRLRGRLDPEDVIQDSLLSASARREEYFAKSRIPFFIWLRLITLQKLAELHRHHLGVKARDVSREVSLFACYPPATSSVLAAKLLGQSTTPSQDVMKAELESRVRDILDELDENDREIIALRNFEKLSNLEAAWALNIGASAASSRYVRALRKLKRRLQALEIEGV